MLKASPPANFSLEIVDIYLNEKGRPDSVKYSDEKPDVILKEGLDLSNVKLVYFTPKVNVPRERVRPFLEGRGIKITRDSAKADVIITCPDYFESNLEHNYVDYVQIEGLKFFLSNFRGMSNASEILTQVNEYAVAHEIKYCLLEDKNYINRVYGADHVNPNKINVWAGTAFQFRESDFLQSSIPRNSVSIVKDTSIYEAAFIDKAYDQKELINLLGETVIDKDSYESIRTMFQSQDKGDHLMGMTVMANSHYEQSFMYLALLLEEYGRTAIDNHPYKNTVAFKSLTKWMGYNRYRFDKDRIFDISLEKALLTPELLGIIKAENLENASAMSDHYDVTDIHLTPETQEKVDKLFKEKGYVDGLSGGGELLQQEVSL